MSDILSRIDQRLNELGKSRRAACIEAGLGPDYLRDMERSKTRSPSIDTLEKLTKPLQTTFEWLRTGQGLPDISPSAAANQPTDGILISKWLLTVAAEKVLAATIAAYRPDLPLEVQEAIGKTMAAELLETLEDGPIQVPGLSEEAAIQVRFQSEAGKSAQRYSLK